jgi:hypothetical protein
MTDAELKKLAVDIVDQKVFGSWMAPDSLIANIFIPLRKGGSDMVPEDVSCLYEYMDKATGMLAHGYPTFFSFKFFTNEERERLVPMIERYRAIKKEFLDVRSSTNRSNITTADTE